VDSVEEQLWLQDQLDDADWLLCPQRRYFACILSCGSPPCCLLSGAIPFQSPPNLVSLYAPYYRTIVTGMEYARGHAPFAEEAFTASPPATDAAAGVYSKIPGTARILRDIGQRHEDSGEDGRCVKSVDISPLLTTCRLGKTQVFQHTGREW
jgi:hypothetical protein